VTWVAGRLDGPPEGIKLWSPCLDGVGGATIKHSQIAWMDFFPISDLKINFFRYKLRRGFCLRSWDLSWMEFIARRQCRGNRYSFGASCYSDSPCFFFFVRFSFLKSSFQLKLFIIFLFFIFFYFIIFFFSFACYLFFSVALAAFQFQKLFFPSSFFQLPENMSRARPLDGPPSAFM
jgi:hypothetical protein